MKGSVRNPIVTWILCLFTCGLYTLFWMYTTSNELKGYLEKSDEELNPTKDLIISIICGPYAILVLLNIGKNIYEAQVKAGIPNAKDQSVIYLLLCMFACGFGYFKVQSDLNAIWEA